MAGSTSSVTPAGDSETGGLARQLLELVAAESSALVRVERDGAAAAIHLDSGHITRVQAEGQESLTVYLVRKGLLSAAGMRAALAEVEQQDVTFGEALEELGLMDRPALAEERNRRSQDAMEELIAGGDGQVQIEERPCRGRPGIDAVGPVVRGLLRSEAATEWLHDKPDFSVEAHGTDLLAALRPAVVAEVGAAALPEEGDLAEHIVARVGEDGDRHLAALVAAGLVVLRTSHVEAPEDLEARAASLSDMREASRLLLKASEAFEKRGDEPGARRAALSALRRSPSLEEPLVRVERLCLSASELATLELVYELVSGAMPGAFGRRSILYRAGKVFEKDLGDIPRAAEYYRRSFNNVPESGAVLEALERMALALDDRASLADAYAAVGMACSRPELREHWLRRAAEKAEAEGGEASALELLLRVHEVEPSIATEALLSELAPGQTFRPAPPPAEPPPDDEVDPLADDDWEDHAAESMEETPEASSADVRRSSWTSLGEAAAAAAEGAGIAGDGESDGPDEPDQRVEEAEASSFEELGDLLMVSEGDPGAEGDDEGAPGPDDDAPPSAELVEDGEGGAKEDVEPDGARRDLASEPAPPPSVVLDDEIREHRDALAKDPGDLARLRSLRASLEASGDAAAEAAVGSILAVCDGSEAPPPLELREPPASDVLSHLAGGLDHPQLEALAILWRAAPQLLHKDLAEMGIVRAVPQSARAPSHASEAFASAMRVLGVETTRLLHVPAGPAVRVVATTPPSVLAGPGAEDSGHAEIRFRIARSVAMTRADLLLATALSPSDLSTTLRGMQAAFGRSLARGSLDFAAASLAQNLWSAMPPETQEQLKPLLEKAGSADAEGVRARALGAANRLGLVATGDVGAALRVAVGDDPFLAGTDAATEEGFSRAARRSEQVAAVVRLALDPAYSELSWKLASLAE